MRQVAPSWPPQCWLWELGSLLWVLHVVFYSDLWPSARTDSSPFHLRSWFILDINCNLSDLTYNGWTGVLVSFPALAVACVITNFWGGYIFTHIFYNCIFICSIYLTLLFKMFMISVPHSLRLLWSKMIKLSVQNIDNFNVTTSR